MSSLIRKKRIHFSPTMAAHFGLYEAIILQFLFWVKNGESSGRVLQDGYRYCYNTYSDWHQLYPFISERTLRRTFGEMESKGLICSTQLNGYERTKFYRISDAIVAQDAKGYFDELPLSHDLQEEDNKLRRICRNCGYQTTDEKGGLIVEIEEFEGVPWYKILVGNVFEHVPVGYGGPPFEIKVLK